MRGACVFFRSSRPRIFRWPGAAAVLISVAACGGGGTSSGSESSPSNQVVGPVPEGQIVFASVGKLVRLDLVSGQAQSTNLALASNERLGWGGGWVTDVEENPYGASGNTEFTVNLRSTQSGFPITETLPVISAAGLRVSGPVQPSADGTHFAVHVRVSSLDEPEPRDAIYVMDKQLQVAWHAADLIDPVWLDNDTLIAAGLDGIYKVSITSNQMTKIGAVSRATQSAPQQPAISPDGSAIVFVQDEIVWRMGMDGHGLMPLTQSLVGQNWPTWSPDGAHVLVVRGSCPVYGAGMPEPDLVVISANLANQSIADAPPVYELNQAPMRSCGPAYWLNRPA